MIFEIEISGFEDHATKLCKNSILSNYFNEYIFVNYCYEIAY